MSEEETPTPSKPPKKPRRTWRQRLKLTVFVLLVLVIALRIAITVLLPTVMRRVASAYDLDCEYGRMKLSLLGGDAQIWNLVLRPKVGGESIVEMEYLQGNISPLDLLRGRLVVYRAGVDGMSILVDREKDGSIPLLKRLLPQSAPPGSAASGSSIMSRLLPSTLRVDAVRVSEVQTTFRDLSITPTFEARIKTSLRISDVGSDNLPTRFELEVAMDPVLDTLLVQGQAKKSPDSLTADVQVLLRGIHPQPAIGYLTPLGLRPVAQQMDVHANLTLTANFAAGRPDISAQLAFNHITATADGTECLSLEKMTVDATSLSTTAARFGRLAIENGQASARRTAAGAIGMAGQELAGSAQSSNVSVSSISLPSGYVVSLDELSLKNLRAVFGDDAVKPAANLIASVDQLSLKGISTDPAVKDNPVPISGTFSLPGLIQTIDLTGSATPFAANKTLMAKVHCQGVKPDAIKPYLDEFGIESQIQNGTINASLNASASIDPAGTIVASATVDGVRFDDGKIPLLAFDSAKISNANWNPTSGAIGVADVEVSGPSLIIHRDHDGRLATSGLRLVPILSRAPTAQVAPATQLATTAPSPAPFAFPDLPRMEIARLHWGNVKITLRDDTTSPPVNVALGDAGLDVNNLLIDLKSATNDHKSGTIHAWMVAPGAIDSLSVDGTLNSEQHQFVADMTVAGKGITGQAIAPYLKDFGIVPVMKAGALSLKSKASLAESEGRAAAALDLSDVKYTDGATELAGVDRLHLAGLKLRPSEISIDQLIVTAPRIGSPEIATAHSKRAEFKLLLSAFVNDSTTSSPDARCRRFIFPHCLSRQRSKI